MKKPRYFVNLSADVTRGEDPLPQHYCTGFTTIDGRKWANYEMELKTKRAALAAFNRLPDHAYSVTAMVYSSADRAFRMHVLAERGAVIF